MRTQRLHAPMNDMKALLLLALVSFSQLAAAAETHTVPTDIQEYFLKNQCLEVSDYYSEDRIIEKPYLYAVVSAATNRKNHSDYSFIAWCKTTRNNPDGQYVLVGQLNGAKWPGGCKFPVRGFDYAGGLSVSRKSVDLSAFTKNQQSIGRSTTFGPVIQSERDGLVYEIFCHERMWVQRSID